MIKKYEFKMQDIFKTFLETQTESMFLPHLVQ